MTSLNELDGQRVLRTLRRFGWVEVRSSGSHRILKKQGHAATLTVPVHKGKPVKQGTMHAILKAAGIDIHEFLKEY